MKSDKDNPGTNALRAGLTDAQLEEAIRTSGYPLQLSVASLLQPTFHVIEEWGFRDAATDTIRPIDLLAERAYHDSDPNRYRVRPTLTLIVECKQSDLPYLFFQSAQQWLQDYPMIAGLGHCEVKVKTDDDQSTWSYRPMEALGLTQDPFFRGPPICMSFSKCERKGRDLELSGTDAYNNLVMPLVSALKDFRQRCKPPKTAFYFEGRIVLGVGVIDAPMIRLEVLPDGPVATLTPWVRVVRNAPPEDAKYWRHLPSPLVLDLVHKDFFQTFIDAHVHPFAQRYASLAHRHHEELAEGKAFAAGLGHDSWNDIEARLQPSTFNLPPPLKVRTGLDGIVQSIDLHLKNRLGSLGFRGAELLRFFNRGRMDRGSDE